MKKHHQLHVGSSKNVTMTSLTRPAQGASPQLSAEQKQFKDCPYLENQEKFSGEKNGFPAPSLVNLNLLTEFASGLIDIPTYKKLTQNSKFSYSGKVH